MSLGTLNRRTSLKQSITPVNNNINNMPLLVGGSPKRSDLYFIRLKDSSSLMPVEKSLLDEHSEFFKRQSIKDYQLSQLNVINLESTPKNTFENIIYCLRKSSFPGSKYNSIELQLKAVQEAYLEAEALCIDCVCILLERYMRSLLNKDTCILLWQLTYKSSQYLRNLAVQSFAYICCFFSHQLYQNRELFRSLKPKELLTILKSPYLCLLDPTETFHLIGNYYVITILTLIDIWSENRVNLDKNRLIEELNLPPTVKAAIKSYHEDHDPKNEFNITSNYKFSSLGFIVYYPKSNNFQTISKGISCPSAHIDPKRWTLKSIEFFMDLRERYIIGCRQSFKNIWMDVEESIAFGNVDTKKTAPGGQLEVGPGEAITAIHVYRSYVASEEKSYPYNGKDHQWSHNSSRKMLFGSAGEAEVLPYFTGVISRCCFTITTYACGSTYTYPRMGLRRQVSLPPTQPNRYDLEESYLTIEVSEVRENCISTASHLFGLAVSFRLLSQNDNTGLTDIIPVWSAADRDSLENLKKYMLGNFCCANDLKENNVLMSDSFSNTKIIRRYSEIKKPSIARKSSVGFPTSRPSSSLDNNPQSLQNNQSSIDYFQPKNVFPCIPSTGTLPHSFTMKAKPLSSNLKSPLGHNSFMSCNNLDKLTLNRSLPQSVNVSRIQLSSSGSEADTLNNIAAENVAKRDTSIPKRRVVFSKNHYLHHFTPDSSSPSATEYPIETVTSPRRYNPRYYQVNSLQKDSNENNRPSSARIPKNYLSCFEDSDSFYGYNQTPPSRGRRVSSFRDPPSHSAQNAPLRY